MRTIIFCKNKNKQYFTRHKNCTTIANNEKYKHYLVQKKLKQHLLQTTNGLFWSRARLKQNYQVPSIGNGDVIITITVWRNNEVVLRVNKCARQATNENLMKFSISILAARQLSLVRLKGSRKGSFSVYQFWVLQHKNRTAKTKKRWKALAQTDSSFVLRVLRNFNRAFRLIRQCCVIAHAWLAANDLLHEFFRVCFVVPFFT